MAETHRCPAARIRFWFVGAGVFVGRDAGVLDRYKRDGSHHKPVLAYGLPTDPHDRPGRLGRGTCESLSSLELGAKRRVGVLAVLDRDRDRSIRIRVAHAGVWKCFRDS
jgi:hypothetical protein